MGTDAFVYLNKLNKQTNKQADKPTPSRNTSVKHVRLIDLSHGRNQKRQAIVSLVVSRSYLAIYL